MSSPTRSTKEKTPEEQDENGVLVHATPHKEIEHVIIQEDPLPLDLSDKNQHHDEVDHETIVSAALQEHFILKLADSNRRYHEVGHANNRLQADNLKLCSKIGWMLGEIDWLRLQIFAALPEELREGRTVNDLGQIDEIAYQDEDELPVLPQDDRVTFREPPEDIEMNDETPNPEKPQKRRRTTRVRKNSKRG
ncbi:hypothetical protein F53441_4217 [Fusarium austroafricanum]|uniref:Uncharacterized protein n=1 Tax=Fusarium austroafricanum TaxID=2364996 RepID=A0A8H4P1X2_9HYPO|nr:hypothetical protein F53441_4217 [Fusarium austroafricanum]